MSKLTPPVSDDDHMQGPADAGLVLVEFGDYECPHCKAAYPVVKTVQAELGHELSFVYRHFPLVEIHPHALTAAEAAEAAGAQGRFWQMHHMLFQNSPELTFEDLLTYAANIELDLQQFDRSLRTQQYLPRYSRRPERLE